MVRPCVALVCALGVLLLVPQAAAGGGWWSYIDLNRSHVAPGQRVELDATVAFRSAAAAQAEQQADRFSVYLLRGFDYSVVERAMRKASPDNWWSLGGAEAIEVGQVTVSVSDANLGRASAAFTVPELPPATYHLMLCDTACTEPLADVIPKGFTLVADPATARMAHRVDRLERRSRNQAGRLAAARADTDKALVAARKARSKVEQLEGNVASLANEGRSARLATPWAYAGWLVAGALAGALALLVLRRRRPGPPRGWRPSDEELRELLSSESRCSR
jgi:multidrug efflux pump subunit AcrA (membrane-fusion protein)